MLSSVDADYCLGRWAGLPPHLDALDGLSACGWLVRLVYNPQRPIDFEKDYVCQEEVLKGRYDHCNHRATGKESLGAWLLFEMWDLTGQKCWAGIWGSAGLGYCLRLACQGQGSSGNDIDVFLVG